MQFTGINDCDIIFFWLILGYTSCFLVKYEPDSTLGTFVLFGRTFRKSLL